VECRRSISGDSENADMSVEMFLPPSDVAQMQDGNPTANITLDFVPQFNCLEANKLEANQECWDFDGCQFEWIAYEWSECSAACGSVAVQTRQVECMRGHPEGSGLGDAANTVVDMSLCKSEMPEVQKYCTNELECTYSWKAGDWAECPRGCGEETQRRSNSCVRSDGTMVHRNFCEGDGWTLVSREVTADVGALSFLGVPHERESLGDAMFNEGPSLVFGVDYDDVLVTSGPFFYRFKPAKGIFESGADLAIPLLDFESNDNRMASWVEDAGAAVFCKASSKSDGNLPSGSSWAILPDGAAPTGTDCGCNGNDGDDMNGRGVFYSGRTDGTASDDLCPTSGGGGFVGASGDGEAKSGPAKATLEVYVRRSQFDVVTSKNDGAVDCNTYCGTGWNEEAMEGSVCVAALDTATQRAIPCDEARGSDGNGIVKCFCDEPETAGDMAGQHCAGELVYVAGNGYLYADQNLLAIGDAASASFFNVPGTRFIAKDKTGKTVFGPEQVNSVQVKRNVNEFGDETWVTWSPDDEGVALSQDYDEVDVYVRRCAAAPSTAQTCESRDGCAYGWSAPLSWDDSSLECSTTCGTGKKVRTVDCVVVDPASLYRGDKAASSDLCDPIDDAAYLEVPCFDDSSCAYEWFADDWQTDHCAEDCGASTMPRVVSCERRAEAGNHASAIATVENGHCRGTPRPADSQSCYSTAKCDYKWNTAEWGTCAAGCGKSLKTRSTGCDRSDKVRVASSECTIERAGPAPADTQECTSFLTCSYAWHVNDGIAPTCDDGEQNGNEEGVDCGGSCPDCVVDGGWGDYGEWSDCSAACGFGTMVATRVCDSPVPTAGGKMCDGAATLQKDCKVQDCSVDFGATCNYVPMDTPLQYTMQLRPGQSETVTVIPVGASQVFVRVQSNADVDLDLSTQDGEALISATEALNWESAQFENYGMSVTGCTDSCQMPLSVTYHADEKEHTIISTSDYNNEYIFIEEVTVPLVLKVAAFEEGTGTVSYGFDCSPACDACQIKRA